MDELKPGEEFVWIKGWEGTHKISNYGTVLSFVKKNVAVIKPRLVDGYHNVMIFRNLWAKTFKVHRLVAMHFVPGYKPWLTVNHKDLNKMNNHFTNLEWMTNAENLKHAWRNQVYAKLHDGRRKPIIGTHIVTGEKIYFRSTFEAEKAGYKRASIRSCIHKKNYVRQHGGYVWEFADQPKNPEQAE